MNDTPSLDALKNLIWFMVALAILGTILVFVIMFTGAVPVGPVTGPPPANPVV